MGILADKVSSILEDDGVLIYLLAKYVDDINIAMSLIPEGSRWVKVGRKWVLEQSDDQKEVDLGEAKTQQERTMGLIL